VQIKDGSQKSWPDRSSVTGERGGEGATNELRKRLMSSAKGQEGRKGKARVLYAVSIETDDASTFPKRNARNAIGTIRINQYLVRTPSLPPELEKFYAR